MAADSARLCVILVSTPQTTVAPTSHCMRGTRSATWHARARQGAILAQSSSRLLPWVYAARCGSCASRSPSASFLQCALRGVVTPPVTLEVAFETMLSKDIADVGPIPKAVVTGLLSVVVSARFCF